VEIVSLCISAYRTTRRKKIDPVILSNRHLTWSKRIVRLRASILIASLAIFGEQVLKVSVEESHIGLGNLTLTGCLIPAGSEVETKKLLHFSLGAHPDVIDIE